MLITIIFLVVVGIEEIVIVHQGRVTFRIPYHHIYESSRERWIVFLPDLKVNSLKAARSACINFHPEYHLAYELYRLKRGELFGKLDSIAIPSCAQRGKNLFR